jgi:hypothetical protein
VGRNLATSDSSRACLLGFALLSLVSCCRAPHFKEPPPPPICESKQQNGIVVMTASATTNLKKAEFTANSTRSFAVSTSSPTRGSETHLLIQRWCQRWPAHEPAVEKSLEVDTESSNEGTVQVLIRLGQGFHGIKEIVLTTTDQITFNGRIDGRDLAPFPIKGDPKSIKFANGSPVPETKVHKEIKKALPIVLGAIAAKCASPTTRTTSSSPLGVGGSDMGASSIGAFAVDPPANPPGDFDQLPCITCSLGCSAYDGCCAVDAIGAAALCGPLYPACLAAAIGYCGVKTVDCNANDSVSVSCLGVPLGTAGPCHLLGSGIFETLSAGPPCCPVLCGNSKSGQSCCAAGDTCAGPYPDPILKGSYCCPAGLTACGQNCCGAGQTCLPNGTCCNSANVCGGQNCCGPGETCTANGSCCAPGHAVCCNGTCCPDPRQVCDPSTNACTCPSGTQACTGSGGQNCCNASDTCMPNGSCCPAGHAVCGNTCCSDPNDVCDPSTNTCKPACQGGAPFCGGTCCAGSQLCCTSTGGPTGVPQCFDPVPRAGLTWCGDRSIPVYCNNCPAGQQCEPICDPHGGPCSTGLYCQTP